MTVKIRPAEATDIAAITAIYAHAVNHGTATYELEPPSEQEMAARYQGLVTVGYPYLVAEVEGKVAGYAYAGPFRTRKAYRFMVEDSIYLAPEMQGRGIGKLLLRGLIEECTGLGFRQFTAVIGDGSDKSASVKLHAALGFEHAGILKGSGYKFGRWLDTYFMQLEMNGGTATQPSPDTLPERMYAGISS